MKAAIHHSYGPPSVVSIQNVPVPVPGAREVLIKVYATTVNRTDCGFRSAVYFVSRFWSGLFKPKYKTLGCEYAGQVVAKGKEVTLFKIDDRVFGYNEEKFGGHAEYICIHQDDAIATIPLHLEYTQAAPICEGGHYALCNIRASKIKSGHHVMVYGATGAIGSAAVQLLKQMGVHVTAVCNTKNVSMLKELQADVVIDYQTEDYTKTAQKFDFIFDAVGKSSFGKCKPLLNEKGIYVSTELGKNGENIWLALTTPLRGGKKVIFPIPTISKADVEFLKSLVEQNHFHPVIDRIYPLDEIVEAYTYVETGQKTGNVVISVVG